MVGKLRVAELFFDVPVDYSKPNGGTLRLFARSIARFNKPVEPTKEEPRLPWLVYLQGGPGFGCSAPQNYGWVDPALTKGYQVRTFPGQDHSALTAMDRFSFWTSEARA